MYFPWRDITLGPLPRCRSGLRRSATITNTHAGDRDDGDASLEPPCSMNQTSLGFAQLHHSNTSDLAPTLDMCVHPEIQYCGKRFGFTSSRRDWPHWPWQARGCGHGGCGFTTRRLHSHPHFEGTPPKARDLFGHGSRWALLTPPLPLQGQPRPFLSRLTWIELTGLRSWPVLPHGALSSLHVLMRCASLQPLERVSPRGPP
ncbi:hypothetical protein B0J13DRAFT_88757 [Dactylonectria estremocensis]|uniref:Uncharacterized protein n=1 Tax=Dactylonectria estremocensis TaxID=1079267 RepID=A0A9P9IY08_9HYPO|nr:hypothetical protein B0J13DRAFT_88757 [Dactylonectria estremocensis]